MVVVHTIPIAPSMVKTNLTPTERQALLGSRSRQEQRAVALVRITVDLVLHHMTGNGCEPALVNDVGELRFPVNTGHSNPMHSGQPAKIIVYCTDNISVNLIKKASLSLRFIAELSSLMTRVTLQALAEQSIASGVVDRRKVDHWLSPTGPTVLLLKYKQDMKLNHDRLCHVHALILTVSNLISFAIQYQSIYSKLTM
jgi:hypothetical protein